MGQIILDTAIQAIHNGYSILPIRPYNPSHGDKTPALPWKKLQTTPLTEQQTRQWFQNDAYGLGIIMGKASQDLAMIELEGKAAPSLPELTSLALNSGLGDLWARLFGWWEQTPTGGYHWYCRVPGNTSGNRKLARTASMQVLAETRENGGYSVIAPTDGTRYHHTQQGGWTALQGGPATAPTFTLEEYETILTIFRTLDQAPAKPAPPQPASHNKTSSDFDGVTPLDDFETKTTWTEILQPAGWTPVYTHGQETFWRRPGKTTGISASTGHATDRDRLYVWTTSTQFEPETPYTKQAAYTLINHDGDYHKAAKHLAAKGYGKPAEHRRPSKAERSLDKLINRLQTQQATQQNSDSTTPTVTNSDNNSEPLIYTRTDDGNALRFTDQYTGKYRYIPERKTWAVWNGHKWDLENGEAAVIEDARKLMRNLPEDDPKDKKHKHRSLSKNAIQAIITLAASSEGIYTPLNQFDTNPYLLNTPDGTVNLKTGQLQPPNPNTLCLRSTNYTPNWNMPTPRWHKFLAQTFAGEPELTHYLQRFLGMTLIGKILEQIISFWNGAGANGKSTMLNVIQQILGIGPTGYTVTIPANMFLKGAENHHPAELAQLQGTRLAITSETEEGQHFAEARIKLLTGSDLISARFMGKNFFTFEPTHTIIMVSNYEPEVRTGGQAFWRRIKKVPFLNTVPPEKRNPHLEEQLLEEAPGILAWIITGTKQYLQTGLNEPQAVKVATSEYENEQDTVKMFVQEMCALGSPNQQGYETPIVKLFTEYETWCRQNAYESVSKNMLTRKLRTYGVTKSRTTHTRFYGGIRLKWDGETDLQKALKI